MLFRRYSHVAECGLNLAGSAYLRALTGALSAEQVFEAAYLIKLSSDSAELAMKAMGLANTSPTSPELMTN